jgi:hypothetical protein
MIPKEQLEFACFTNNMLKEINADWRIGFIVKAWQEDMEGDDKTGGLGIAVWVFKDSIIVVGEQEPMWLIHPKSHEEYKLACGNPEGRWPFVLDQALIIPGVNVGGSKNGD